MPAKPATAVYDSGNGLASGNVLCLPLCEGSGVPADLAPGSAVSLSASGTPTWVTLADGPAVHIDAGSEGFSCALPAGLQLQAPFTVAIVARFHGTPDANSFLGGAWASDTFAAPYGAWGGFVSGGSSLVYHYNDGSYRVVDGGAASGLVSSGDVFVLMGEHLPDPDNAVQGFLDGASLGYTVAGTVTYEGTARLVLGDTFSGNNPNCDVLGVFAWDRLLSSGEKATFLADPWALARGTPADSTPPTLGTLATNTGGDTITGTLSESGCTPASGTGGFTLGGTSATVASWAISGATLTLTLSGTVAYGETVTLSYDDATASTAIEDAAGNLLADIAGASVTNNVPQPLTAGTASFVSSGPGGISVEATAPTGGSGSGPTYQWERNEDGGAYADVSGATSLTLTDTTPASTAILYRYRCKQTRGTDTVTTNAVAAQVYEGGAIGTTPGEVDDVTADELRTLIQGDIAAAVAYLASKTASAPGFGTWGTYDPATDSLEAADEAGTAAADLLGTPAGASLAVDIAAVKTDTAAVKLKTDALPADPAGVSDLPDVSGLATATALAAVASDVTDIAGAVDTEVAAILSAVQPAAIRTALGMASADLDTQLDAIASAAGGTSDTPLDSGTAQAGGASTITLKAGTTITPDRNTAIILTGGTGAGQTGWVDSYNGTTKVATMTANWNVAPDGTTTYDVVWVSGSDQAAGRAAAAVAVWVAAGRTLTANTNLSIPTPAQIADALLGRNVAGGSDGGHTVSRALRVAGGSIVLNDDQTFEVFAQDGVTVVASGTYTADENGNLTGLAYE